MDILRKIKERVSHREIGWEKATEIFFQETGEKITAEALRGRCRKLKDKEVYNSDGTLDLLKRITFNENEEKTPDTIIRKLGYNPDVWVMVYHTFGTWETYVKDEGLQLQTTVRVKLKPREDNFSLNQAVEIAKEVFSNSEIKARKIPPKPRDKTLNDDLLLECPAMELHLAKMAWSGDVGEDYDKDIAQERFKTILKEIVENQHIQRCGNAVVYIGNDFFNTDTTNNMTTKGTLQNNDTRWKKMFQIGLSLYIEFLETLRQHFNSIDVKLCQGNHDVMSSFYLFIALKEGFKNDNIVKFSEDIKETQAYIFGDNLIITNHGAVNQKRLIQSIPAEFYQEWGKTLTRHLHLGHFHKEFSVDDQSGLIIWRVGSPTGTDDWHYSNRYFAQQKYQTFLWDRKDGLKMINYTNFTRRKK